MRVFTNAVLLFLLTNDGYYRSLSASELLRGDWVRHVGRILPHGRAPGCYQALHGDHWVRAAAMAASVG